jgi:hypothetical protein
MKMHLKIAGKEMLVEVEDESRFRSKHTGSELRRINASLVLPTPMSHRKFLIGIKRGEVDGIPSTDGTGNITGRWAVKDSDFIYLDGQQGTEYWHNLYLEEIEEFHIDSLSIGGLLLQPYFYEEEFDCDELSISARVMVTQEQDIVLRKMMVQEKYFPVIRHGICDVAREMRFSRTILWSKHHHNIKYELILIDKGYDERDPLLSRVLQPQMSRMQHMIASQSQMVEGLLSMLHSKGFIEEEDIAVMKAEAAGQVWNKIREFYEVGDLDEFRRPRARISWD